MNNTKRKAGEKYGRDQGFFGVNFFIGKNYNETSEIIINIPFINPDIYFQNLLNLFFFFADLCRHLKFTTPVDGYALQGHVIKNISLNLGMRASCKGRCSIDSNCVSVNIGSPINDKVLCQLSYSDHLRHPDDLKPREGFVYRGTQVTTLRPAYYFSSVCGLHPLVGCMVSWLVAWLACLAG